MLRHGGVLRLSCQASRLTSGIMVETVRHWLSDAWETLPITSLEGASFDVASPQAPPPNRVRDAAWASVVLRETTMVLPPKAYKCPTSRHHWRDHRIHLPHAESANYGCTLTGACEGSQSFESQCC